MKLLAVFAALITFLGTPAVVVQFVRFHIPLQFMTRDQALRAGIMPAICLIALGLGMYWAVSNPKKVLGWLEPFRYGGRVAKEAGMAGVALTDTSRWLTATTVIVLILLPFAAIWNYGLHHFFGYLPQSIQGMGRWLLLQKTVWVALVLASAAVFLVVFRRLAFKVREGVAKIRIVILGVNFVGLIIDHLNKLADRLGYPLLQGAVFAVILSGLLALYLLLQKFIYGGPLWLWPELWGTLLKAFACGCVISFLAVLAGALTQLADSRTKSQGQVTAYGAIFIIYFPLVALYASQWYPYIPYALGGGHPAQVTVWLEKKSVPESFKKTLGCKEDGDLSRCETAYLLDHDSDRTILVDSAFAHTDSFSVVFSKEAVKAINSERP
ncbi:MAG TPA: hypothetical protein VEI73_06245 [Candidatus Acidoferrum sp.]|nr:hypothetical protein [Candidatus Acidoferrum sp.]